MGIEVALLSGTELRLALGGGDVVIGRLDVLPTLDGVEAGLFDLLLVEHAGVRVVNSWSRHDAWHERAYRIREQSLDAAVRRRRCGLRSSSSRASAAGAKTSSAVRLAPS